MNVFKRLALKALFGGANNSLTWRINSSGEWVYPSDNANDYIDKGYKQLPNVYAIISLILQKSTIVPFEVYKVKDKSKERKYKAMMRDSRNIVKALKLKNEAYEKVENTDLDALLNNPNEYQSLEQLWWEIDGYKLLTGNSYLYGIEVGSKPKELHSIPSPFVDLKVSGTPFAPEFKYQVSYLKQPLQQEEIYHFKTWNPIVSDKTPSQQYLGVSPLQSCRLLLGRYYDADITQGFMFKNQGPGGLLVGESSGDITQEQAVAVQDRFKQQHTGTHKANDIIVVPSKMSWTSIGLSPVDLNILEGKSEILGELCNVYKVPIGLFSDKNSTENNMIESRKALLTDAVIPLVEARKSILNKFLAPKFGNDIVLEYDYSIFHELQEDLEKQAKIANESYILTLDERRAIMNYPPMENGQGNINLIPSGLSTLEDVTMGSGEINEDILPPDAEL